MCIEGDARSGRPKEAVFDENLTIDQNQQRVDDLEQCLAIFNRNKDEFFRRYITMDVTWLLHNSPESNQ
jgi:hypothetical protein